MSVDLAQQLLFEKFKTEPFHNLYLLHQKSPTTHLYGGTCSDKTLSYLGAAKNAGLDAHLHSARINGQEIHRLVRLEIDNERYFADIGNGWPSIKLYSATRPVRYECYGMCFRTNIDNGTVSVYHRKNGVEKKQMEIDSGDKSHTKVMQEISNRFSSNIVYPFSDQLRFSMIVGDQFLFIRDTKLEVYSKGNYEEVTNIDRKSLRDTIKHYFSYDIKSVGLDEVF